MIKAIGFLNDGKISNMPQTRQEKKPDPADLRARDEKLLSDIREDAKSAPKERFAFTFQMYVEYPGMSPKSKSRFTIGKNIEVEMEHNSDPDCADLFWVVVGDKKLWCTDHMSEEIFKAVESRYKKRFASEYRRIKKAEKSRFEKCAKERIELAA